MKKACLAGLLALTLLVSGCGPRGAEDPVVPSPSPSASAAPTPPPEERTFGLAYDPQGGWDPYGEESAGNRAVMPLLYEGLFELDEKFSPSPVLALSARTEDGLVWTLTLRDGVSFSDGTPLTGETAGRAVDRARRAGSPYAGRLAALEKVRWEGMSLTLTLTEGNRELPALLDFPIAHVTEEGIFGTGPYEAAGTLLSPRESWWRGAATPGILSLTPATDADGLLRAFDEGRLSLAVTDLTRGDALGYAGAYNTWEYPTSTMIYVGTRLSGGICAQPEVRRAVSLALDRGRGVREALGGHAAVAAYPAAPGSARYDEQAAGQLSYDPEGAAALLEGLGWKRGEDGLLYEKRKPVGLTMLVNAESAAKEAMARGFAEDLEALGLTVELKVLGWDAYVKALEREEFDLYLGEWRLTGDMDLTAYFAGGSGLCYGGHEEDEAMAAALAAARATGDWGEFHSLWVQAPALAAVCFKSETVLTAWGRCGGLRPTQGNVFYRLGDWVIS